MKIRNKNIIVTGAANGMGREMTLLLLNRGARVAAFDMSEPALLELKKAAGNNVSNLSLHVVNITDRSAVNTTIMNAIQLHNGIDGIINNAGIIQPFVRVNDLDFPDIERVMNVNFYGILNTTKALLPHLIKRPEAHIVNISSMGGFLPVPGQSVYGASKAAVKLLTEGMRSELLDTKVKVSIVFPGAIGTNIAANSGVKIEMPESKEQKSFNPLPADKAAEIIIDGMENNKYRILVGSDVRFMDFLYRLAPKFAAEFIFKKMKALLNSM